MGLLALFTKNQSKFLDAARAGEAHIVQETLNKGVDIEARYSDGYTALMSAATHGHASVVQILLSRGANINARCNKGEAALHRAVWKEHLAIAEMLLQEDKAKPDCVDNIGITPLMAAAYIGNGEIYRLLLTYGAREEPGLAMILSAAIGNTNDLLVCLERGSDPNYMTTAGMSALSAASYNGQLAATQILIERGANVNLKNKFGTSPLMTAAREGHRPIVKFLLDKGADPNVKNEKGESAISRAAKQGQAEIEVILKRAGARA